jgi:uncharacterized delta-60 repeat protein
MSAAAFAAGTGLLPGCQTVLGIEDVRRDPAGSGGEAPSSTTTSSSASAQGGGGAGGGDAGGGDAGGSGGEAPDDAGFVFAIRSTEVHVPYDGRAHVDVEVTRLGGFTGAVRVEVQGAPAGLIAQALTIGPDTRGGRLEIGASGPLTLGTAFELTLLATSGALARTDAVPARVSGKPGTLAMHFGTGGLTAWSFGSDGAALHDVRDTVDGKILVAGVTYGGLGGSVFRGSRLLADGTLDASFGGGTVNDGFCGCTHLQEARGIMRRLNGNVILVGSARASVDTSQDIAVLRLKDDGTPDDAPRDEGKALIDLGGEEHVLAAEPTEDDKLVVTGERDGQLFVARIETQYGTLDKGFGPESGVVAPLPDGGSAGKALALDRAGRVVVAARVEHPDGGDMAVLRLTARGALDPEFGSGGVAALGGPDGQDPVAVAVQPDGRIVVAARASKEGAPGDFMLVRLEASGALDMGFGDRGQVVAPISPGDDVPVDMVLLPGDRIVVGGNGPEGPVLARFLPDGRPDPTFGTMGVERVYLGDDDSIQSMTLTRDGKLLLAGVIESFPYKAVVASVWY